MATLTVTRDPTRESALIEIEGMTPATVTFTLERSSPSGNVVDVRGAVNVPTGGEPDAIVRDWEIPFGVPVVYLCTFYDAQEAVVETATAPFTLDYEGCPAWLVDLAEPTNSLAVTIETFSPLDFAVAAGVMRVLERRAPVLVTLPAWTPESELVLLTDTLAERDAMRMILGSGYPVLLRTVPEQGIGNMYLGVTDFKEERFLSLGVAAPRRWTVATVQVERPDPAIFVPIPPTVYAVVAADFNDYADLLAQAHTYDALAYWDFSTATSGTLPWLPSDV